jgi:putative phosphoesterase
MKLAILSDTHGNYPLAVKALGSLEQLDYVIHLGDTTEDAEMIELALGRELIKLSGNCDLSKKYPELIITTIAGKKLLFSHGDHFMVKSGLNLIQQRAKQEKADVVLYGHTHRPAILNIDGIMFINPGSMNKNASNWSFALLTIDNNNITAEIVDICSIPHCAESSSSCQP